MTNYMYMDYVQNVWVEFGVVTKSQCQVAVNHSNFTLNAWLGKLFILLQKQSEFLKK